MYSQRIRTRRIKHHAPRAPAVKQRPRQPQSPSGQKIEQGASQPTPSALTAVPRPSCESSKRNRSLDFPRQLCKRWSRLPLPTCVVFELNKPACFSVSHGRQAAMDDVLQHTRADTRRCQTISGRNKCNKYQHTADHSKETNGQ
jgi:hypothetical protein